jgi:hypothetical protein
MSAITPTIAASTAANLANSANPANTSTLNDQAPSRLATLELEIALLSDRLVSLDHVISENSALLETLLSADDQSSDAYARIANLTTLLTQNETARSALISLLSAKEQAASTLRSVEASALPAQSRATTPAPTPPASDQSIGVSNPSPPMKQNFASVLNALPPFSSDSKASESRVISDPHAFIERFSIVLSSLSIPNSLWFRFLPPVCNQLHANWIIHNLCAPTLDPSEAPTWDEIVKRFFEHFDNPHQDQISLSKLFNAKMLPKESVKNFSDRFQHLLREAKKSDTDNDFFQLYLSRLPQKIQLSLLSEVHLAKLTSTPIQSISRLIQSAISYDAFSGSDSMKSYSSGPSNCLLHPQGNHKTTECHALKKSFESNLSCLLHPHSTHTATNCNLLKNVFKKQATFAAAHNSRISDC